MNCLMISHVAGYCAPIAIYSRFDANLNQFNFNLQLDQYSWCALLGDFLHVLVLGSKCQVVLLNFRFQH